MFGQYVLLSLELVPTAYLTKSTEFQDLDSAMSMIHLKKGNISSSK